MHVAPLLRREPAQPHFHHLGKDAEVHNPMDNTSISMISAQSGYEERGVHYLLNGFINGAGTHFTDSFKASVYFNTKQYQNQNQNCRTQTPSLSS